MTLTTLVTGATAAAREAAILHSLEHCSTVPGAVSMILEGLPGGVIPPEHKALIVRIAPRCVCCTVNLIMCVSLNRILRHSPQRLYISLASSAHLDGIRAFLSSSPYDDLLELTQDLSV